MWKLLNNLENKILKDITIKDLSDEIKQINDSYTLDNKIALNSVVERFKRYVTKNYDVLSNYGKYEAKKLLKRTKLTNAEISKFLLYILYSRKQKEIDEISNIAIQKIVTETYKQETEKVHKQTGVIIPLFDIGIIATLMAMSNSRGYVWNEYMESTTLYNADETYRYLLINGSTKGINDLVQKQKNRILKVKKNPSNEDKYTGALEEQLVFVINQTKLQAYTDMGIEKVQFIGVEDKNQTPMCQTLDRQVFLIDKLNIYSRYSDLDKKNIIYKTQGLKVGENLPPINNCFHWCRSSITYLVN
jgi:hypothetical protein